MGDGNGNRKRHGKMAISAEEEQQSGIFHSNVFLSCCSSEWALDGDKDEN